MAKQSGLGDRLFVGGYDLSGDTQALKAISGALATIDVTGIDKSAHERIGGLRQGHIDWTSYFNPTGAHPVLAALPTGDVQLTYCRGVGIGVPAASLVSKQINYNGNRAKDGQFTFECLAQSNAYGLEWGVQLTNGLRTDTTATNGTANDYTTVSTAFGWQAYLHVTAFTGTSVTVTLQDSADNSSFTNLTGGAFTAATAIGTQRLAGASNATVRRYVRAITSGTFTSATFAVVFVKNDVAVSF